VSNCINLILNLIFALGFESASISPPVFFYYDFKFNLTEEYVLGKADAGMGAYGYRLQHEATNIEPASEKYILILEIPEKAICGA
jgi:hypothetical protein